MEKEYGGTAWYEFKQWTKVNKDESITAPIPVVKYFYPYRTGLGYLGGGRSDSDNPRVISYKPHFFTPDGAEVTDKVTIGNIKAYYYTASDSTSSTTHTTNLTYDENDETNSEIYINLGTEEIGLKNEHILTTVEITKSDKNSNTQLLKGAKYEIQDKDGNVVAEFEETNEEGKAVLEDLALDVGTYYLVETKAPNGYALSPEKIAFEVKAHTSSTVTKTVTDEKINVKVEKQDEYENMLAEAKLQLLDSTGAVVKTFDSKLTQEVIEGLSAGTYTLHELTAPRGYEKAENIEFSITETGETKINGEVMPKVVMKDNVLKGSINITKKGEVLSSTAPVNAGGNNAGYIFTWKNGFISGVTYELYANEDIILNGTKLYSKDEKIELMETGANGVATYSGLPMGNYYVIEKSAPEGYEVDTEKKTISLFPMYTDDTDGGKKQTLVAAAELTDERKQETIEITKTEKGTAIPVEGAKYGLYNKEKIGSIEANTLLDRITTNEAGKGTFTVDLPVGNYYVKEIEAPEGYALSKEIKNINFKETTDFKLNVEDDYTKVKIEKIDEKGNYLSGAELQIVDSQGNVVEKWISKKEAHEINKKLKAGETYTLQEVVAPNGYEKIQDITFTVSEDGSIDTIRATDKKIKAILPKTGDWMTLYVAVLVLAVGGIVLAVAGKKGKN